MSVRIPLKIELFPGLNLTLDSSFCHGLNLSSTNPPSNRMQMTPDVIDIWDRNLYGPESNIDCIYRGEVWDFLLCIKLGIICCLVTDELLIVTCPGKIFMIMFVVRLIIKTCMVIILPEIIWILLVEEVVVINPWSLMIRYLIQIELDLI